MIHLGEASWDPEPLPVFILHTPNPAPDQEEEGGKLLDFPPLPRERQLTAILLPSPQMKLLGLSRIPEQKKEVTHVS